MEINLLSKMTNFFIPLMGGGGKFTTLKASFSGAFIK